MSQVETPFTPTECKTRGGPICKVKLGTARSSINKKRGRAKGSNWKNRNGLGNQLSYAETTVQIFE